MKRKTLVAILPVENITAVKRVLKLVDGYMGTQTQDELLAYNGGIMTWRGLRQQLKAANRLLKVNTDK